ncbi:hypothetical protein PG993_010752 [Apiospora rasikravindrae]|uniref:Uncharacterized protein n=1 Tax=Apiospora rasikravindrae TaxID=990691 RepID=A0ABR1SCK2_9PEZI
MDAYGQGLRFNSTNAISGISKSAAQADVTLAHCSAHKLGHHCLMDVRRVLTISQLDLGAASLHRFFLGPNAATQDGQWYEGRILFSYRAAWLLAVFTVW